MSPFRNFAAIRLALYELHEGRCCYCGLQTTMPPPGWRTRHWTKANPPYATIEHKTPVSRGGTNDMSNLALACVTCNQVRGAMLSPGFSTYLVKHSKRVRAREMNR